MNLQQSIDQTVPRKALYQQTGVAIDLGDDVIAEIVTITPRDAAQWLKANQHNRPVVRSHVHFLAKELIAGQWQLNGQPIVVSDGENILDGQHRLLAIIESGIEMRTLVIYGISQDAFKTIDTGKVRTSADALALYNPKDHHHKDVASAVRWLQRMEAQFYGNVTKMSNTDVLEYVARYPSIQNAAEYVASLPKEGRPLSLACGTALCEFFSRRDADLALVFIRNLYTGENLVATSPEYILRAMLARDATQLRRLPSEIRMKMAVKAWNVRRRNVNATRQAIAMSVGDSQRLVIL